MASSMPPSPAVEGNLPPPPPPPPPPHAPLPKYLFYFSITILLVGSCIGFFFVYQCIISFVIQSPHFTLNSLSLSSFNTSSSQISGHWNLNFTLTNPNHHLHLFYHQLHATLLYDSSFIVETQLSPFDQGAKSRSTMSAKLVADSTYIEPRLAKEIINGGGEFRIEVDANVRFKNGAWSAMRSFGGFCEHVVVGIRANGDGRRCEAGVSG